MPSLSPPRLGDTSKRRGRSQNQVLSERLIFRTQKLNRFLLTLKHPLSSLNSQPKTLKAVAAEQGRKCPSPVSEAPHHFLPQHPAGCHTSPATLPGWRHTGGNPMTRAGRTNPKVSPNIPVCPRTRNLRPVFCKP